MEKPRKSPTHGYWLDVWHVNPSVNRDYDFIDGLRGIAILMVLVCHHLYVNPRSGPAVQFIGGVFSACGHGVALFFALSGFLISWPFWKRKFSGAAQVVPTGYGWRRFWKIYPPLALSVLVLTPAYVFLHQDWSYVPVAAQWLAGIPFFLPVSGQFNPVMWTLVIEVQFYVLLPLLFLCLRRVPARVCLWTLSLLFLLVPFLFRFLTGHSATFYPEINSWFPSALDSFGLGILVAGLENLKVLKKSWSRLGWVGLALWPLTLLAIAWLQTHPEHGGFAATEAVGWMGKIASGCLLCYVANPQCSVARLLCAPWLRWCGIVSYEWYLLHQPVIVWARNLLGPAGGNPGKYAVIVGGSLLVSTAITALVYRWFSLPILKFGRASAKK